MPGIVTAIIILVMVNTVSCGVWFIWRGAQIKRRLHRMVRVPATIRRGINSFRGTVIWNHMGTPVTTVKRHLYLLPQRERIHLFYHPETLRTELDIWTSNGTGTLLTGIALILFAIGTALAIFG